MDLNIFEENDFYENGKIIQTIKNQSNASFATKKIILPKIALKRKNVRII